MLLLILSKLLVIASAYIKSVSSISGGNYINNLSPFIKGIVYELKVIL